MTTDQTYVMSRTSREQQRLIRQAEFLREITEPLLREAGVGAGMHVVDLGCGVGDVSLLAARLVRAHGSVLGVDIDEASLATARERATAQGLDNVSFAAGDLRQPQLERDVDAVVGRLILMHLPDPAQVLRAAADALRPGGLICFHEPDLDAWTIDTEPHAPVLEQCATWVREVLTRAGLHTRMGRRLPQAFHAAGLSAPSLRMSAVTLQADTPHVVDWVVDTVSSLLPAISALGVATVAEVGLDSLTERLHTEIAAIRPTGYAFPMVGAWARMPS